MTSEPAKRLRETVGQLEDELNRIDSLDDKSRQVVQDAMERIQRRLDQPGEGGEDRESVADRLEELEQEFQARHPTIAGLLLQAVEALRQLGI